MRDLSKPVYIRENLDVPTKELAEELNESFYYVWLCKEVALNKNLQGSNSGRDKYPSLTEDMKDFLLRSSDNLTRRELRDRFNRKFKDSNISPITAHSIKRYKRKIRGQERERVSHK